MGQPLFGTTSGIRTRATALKGQRPRPLDDGGIRPSWWAWQDLNLRPADYESDALTPELQARRQSQLAL
jgi:hypothetical protein